jgi:hypothetical protein
VLQHQQQEVVPRGLLPVEEAGVVRALAEVAEAALVEVEVAVVEVAVAVVEVAVAVVEVAVAVVEVAVAVVEVAGVEAELAVSSIRQALFILQADQHRTREPSFSWASLLWPEQRLRPLLFQNTVWQPQNIH